MWKLTEIYAQNICSFRELNYKITQGVTTLIFGDNRDNESQRSNGSGKSALIECIAIGITGSPLRRIKNEEIINDHSDECLIEISFINNSIKEVFKVERRLYRKGASSVDCYTIYSDNKIREHSQPGVDGYNKFILETLGLTKDELYNNFILSKHKYQDFLSCPDKDKKDIINRFSNGNLVDQAIERILEDKNPLLDFQKRTDLEYAGLTGRIEVLSEQIEKEENSQEEKVRSKTDRIQELNNIIVEKRNHLREKSEQLNRLSNELIEVEKVDKLVQDLENGDFTLEEYFSGVGKLIPLINSRPMTDWKGIIRSKKEKIHASEIKLKEWDSACLEVESSVKTMTDAYQTLNKEYKLFISNSTEESKKYDKELDSLATRYKSVNFEIENIKRIRRALSEGIEFLKNKLTGVISCPSCGFEFIVSDQSFDVEAGKRDVVQKEEESVVLSSQMNEKSLEVENIDKTQQAIRDKKREITTAKHEWSERILSAEKDVSIVQHKLDRAKLAQSQIIDSIHQLQSEIDGILRQAFDEAFEYIDEAYKTNERKRNILFDEQKAFENSIDMLQQNIDSLKRNSEPDRLCSLKKSLEEYRCQASMVLDKKTKIAKEVDLLSQQEQNFIEFKTYLANSKIEALNKITNEFLENIGSDIRLKLSGYTVLKSGKVREKISVSLVRSGLDSGSFGKFSAGEAARVNLATILAMQKLVNGNCEMDRGLDLLVLDEILEAVDEEGLANMFAALNKLLITALVVSHGNIAESYPHKIKIVKENGESRLESIEN